MQHMDAARTSAYNQVTSASIYVLLFAAHKSGKAAKYDDAFKARVRASEALVQAPVMSTLPSGGIKDVLNGVFNHMVDRHGPEFMGACRRVAMEPTHEPACTLARSLASLYCNASAVGYHAILQLLVRKCPAVLIHAVMEGEVLAICEMSAALLGVPELESDGSIGYYTFYRRGRISFTSFQRQVPTCLANRRPRAPDGRGNVDRLPGRGLAPASRIT